MTRNPTLDAGDRACDLGCRRILRKADRPGGFITTIQAINQHCR